jgi:hypothetical protein
LSFFRIKLQAFSSKLPCWCPGINLSPSKMQPSNALALALAVLPLTYGSVIAERSTSGIATWYAGAVGACSFDGYTLPAGVFGTALGLNLYSTAAQCGACVSVKNAAGKSITAMVCCVFVFPNASSELLVADLGSIDRRRMSRRMRRKDIRSFPNRLLQPRHSSNR